MGLLHLARLSEASKWFSLRISGWLWKFDGHLKEEDPDVPPEPWKIDWPELRKALYSALFSGDDDVIIDTLAEVEDRLAHPLIQRYEDPPGFRYHRIAALYAVLADEDPTSSFDRLEEVIPNAGKQYQTPRYHGELQALRGIHEGDVDAVEDGLQQIVDIHDQYIEDHYEQYHRPPEDLHVTEQCVEYHATALTALARYKGLDVCIESEYVPKTVYELA